MLHYEQISELLHLLHRTTLEPQLWKQFLSRLRDMVGAKSALLGESVGLARSVGGQPEWVERYNQYFRAISPFLPHLARAKSGDVLQTADMVDIERFKRSEYYLDFLKPQGVFLGASGVVFGADDGFADIAVMWPDEKQEIEHDYLELLRLLVPHAATVLQVQRRLDSFALQRDLSLEAMQWMPYGIVLLGSDGSVARMNDRARRIIARHATVGHALRGDGEGNPVAHEIQRLCADTVLRRDDAPARGGTRRVHVGEAKWCEILVSPVEHPTRSDGVTDTAALVFISDPEAPARSLGSRLAQLYGLTPAEAAVAERLLDGLTAKEIAFERGVDISTVRSQIRQLLHKTGTSRQVEAIRTMVQGVAVLQPRS